MDDFAKMPIFGRRKHQVNELHRISIDPENNEIGLIGKEGIGQMDVTTHPHNHGLMFHFLNGATIPNEHAQRSVSTVSEAARNYFIKIIGKCYHEQFERLRENLPVIQILW